MYLTLMLKAMCTSAWNLVMVEVVTQRYRDIPLDVLKATYSCLLQDANRHYDDMNTLAYSDTIVEMRHVEDEMLRRQGTGR